MTPAPADCPLCATQDPPPIWRDARLRVVSAGDPDYPGYLRVIWQAHVAEMSDLVAAEREHLLLVVLAVERALRATLHPAKINLASLGNQVPHLHWHVIPRFADDPHFPDPVWAARRRGATPRPFDVAQFSARLTELLGP
ncbi:MAG: HIT family protein [Gammaproteobacteria bacterium]|nr:HIT family protein [Gammaproteobacteria bacterium]